MEKGLKKRVLETLGQEQYAVQELRKSLDTSFFKAVDILSKRKNRIIVTGVGKSSFVGLKMVATLVSLGHLASFLHPAEALHGDTGIVSDGDVLIAFSFSGESKEVVTIVDHIKKQFSVLVISITANKKSSLGALSDAPITFCIREEGSPLNLAPMASTTASLVLSDLLVSAITSPVHFRPEQFAKHHPGGSLSLKVRKVEDLMVSGNKLPLTFNSTAFFDVLKEMNKKKLGVVGVTDKKGSLVGVITDGDVRRFLVNGGNLNKARAQDVMSIKPKIISSKASLAETLLLMEKHKITSLFVEDKKHKPIGIIHIHDIV